MNFDIELAGQKHHISIQKEAEGYRFQLDGKPCSADVQLLQPNLLSLLIEGRSYRILFDPRPGGESAVVIDERRIPYQLNDPRSLRSRGNLGASDTGARPIAASMPGRIVRILVKVGDSVEARQGLMVVEAMKMQNELEAPRAGKVTRIATEVGATVQTGNILMVIE
ncbi:MAG TPA: acetyl-CoA carboxylase biotin carboxyl carrier protein subunit [Acidobacteriaceae bacterium]|nr:acetyl-CoA carboxylase biotin carboxyl carrier protein subunit [Acidobacteriaceae bacterium]